MYPNESTKQITFVVTENCNFACKYCYLPHKNNKNKMSFDIARQAVDYIIDNRALFPEEMVILDFIGGEPLLESKLIGRIIQYFFKKSYEIDHPWFYNSMVAMPTNGSLYANKRFQQILKLLGSRIEVSITIDGTKRVHDLCRVTKKGVGTSPFKVV